MSRDIQPTFVPRPYVLDGPTQKLIVEAIREGNYLTVACEAAGTTARCFDHWRLRYENGDPEAQRFADFFLAIKRAKALAEQDALRNVHEGSLRWQCEAWFLERRYPKRWGKKDRTPDPPPPPKPIDTMTPAELDAYEKTLGG